MAMAQQSSQRVMSFQEIVQGRDANVRVTSDGFMHAVDLVMVMTGKSRDDAGKAIRNLPNELFSSADFTYKNMPGSGNSKVKTLTFKRDWFLESMPKTYNFSIKKKLMLSGGIWIPFIFSQKITSSHHYDPA